MVLYKNCRVSRRNNSSKDYGSLRRSGILKNRTMCRNPYFSYSLLIRLIKCDWGNVMKSQGGLQYFEVWIIDHPDIFGFLLL
jgi:hypothetical protein